jgi:hypothetical protein
MEKIMLKMKSTKISTLLIVAALMILPLVLAACDTATDLAEVPFGLRTEETDQLVESETTDVSEIAEPAINVVADTPVEASNPVEDATETLPDVVTAGVGVNNDQARTADRSDHTFDPATAAELNPAEMEGLIHMREEEKLARDVYLALYEVWGVPIFQNIAGSEQAHMDSVLMLLEQYELTDPAAGMGVGEFTNPIFQTLYEDLVNQGSLSQADALIVGATIEDLDVFDLIELLAQTDNEYIIQVYNNLLAGSENHLRAFVSNLERQSGEGYQPVYIDQVTYQAIIDGVAERGAGNGGFGGGGNDGSSNDGKGNGRRGGQGRNA